MSRGRHRRTVLVPERWSWFWLVTLPVWGQLVAWPFVDHRRHAYDLAVLVLGVVFAGYLAYFVANRRGHLRRRADRHD